MRHPNTLRAWSLFAATAAVLMAGGCSAESSSRATTAPTDAASSPSSSEPPSPDSASDSASPPTDLIADVEFDGRRIHVTCFGPTDGAAPTVLFEAGGGSPSDTWDTVVDTLSPTRRTCSYDRAGVGASPLPPKPRRTTKDLVGDLEAVLDGAEIEGPFVLVAHSMGVWPVSVYAAAHPDEVAGVVLVDPRAPHISARWRDALPPPSADEPDAVTGWRDELGDFEHDPTLNPEHLDLTRSAAEASAVLDPEGPLFGDVPMLVLGASDTHLAWSDLPPALARLFSRIWLGEQQALAEESTNGTFEVVADSRHEIQGDQPQAVVDAVESVLAGAAG